MRIPFRRGVAAAAAGAAIALTIGATTAQAQEVDSAAAPACIDTEINWNWWLGLVEADVTNNCDVTHSVTVLWGHNSEPDDCVTIAPGETANFWNLPMTDYRETKLC